MADIFGRTQDDYTLRADLHAAGRLEGYEAGLADRRPAANPRHDFQALGSGVPEVHKRASEDAQALGFLTSNLLAIQSAVDEIMYTAYRLPMFVHLNTSIPEGADSYAVRVQNRVGRSTRVTAPAYDAPSATVSETLVDQKMFDYGLDAKWSISASCAARCSVVDRSTPSRSRRPSRDRWRRWRRSGSPAVATTTLPACSITRSPATMR